MSCDWREDINNEIINDRIFLGEVRPVQQQLLNRYRLTEEFRVEYGKIMMSNPNGAVYKNSLNAFEEFNMEYTEELMVDLMYTRLVLGFSPWEYFTYGFKNKSIIERTEFLPMKMNPVIYGLLNPSRSVTKLLGSKYDTYSKVPWAYKRDAILVLGDESNELFKHFCMDKEKIIVKPNNSTLGKDIEILDVSKKEELNDIFQNLIAKNKKIICEELIVQDSSFRKIHPESVNSVRIFTYYNKKDEVKIACAWLKAGTDDKQIDNGSTGGLLAEIDTNTGYVVSDWRDEKNHIYTNHPNSGVKSDGFCVKSWEECVFFVKCLAKEFPAIPLIGWDVALSQNKGWQLIEGNEAGMINLIQVCKQKGLRREILELIEFDKRRKKARKAVTK